MEMDVDVEDLATFACENKLDSILHCMKTMICIISYRPDIADCHSLDSLPEKHIFSELARSIFDGKKKEFYSLAISCLLHLHEYGVYRCCNSQDDAG